MKISKPTRAFLVIVTCLFAFARLGPNVTALAGTNVVALAGTNVVALAGTNVVALAGTNVVALAGTNVVALAREDTRTSTVGFPGRITDLVLPGSELEVIAQDAKSAVVLRITRVAPHGTDFRYDLEWTGLDPGEHDLRAFLRRKDGTSATSLPAVPVSVRTVLPPGQVKPNHPRAREVPPFGGYRTWWIVGGTVWTIGLVWILLGFRRRRLAERAAVAPPRTLAERLRPLVERALEGSLSRTQRAELELGLVAYWRRQLALDERRPDEAHAILRAHAEAGPLLNQLDAWLHKPGSSDEVDVGALLAPYQNLPADALDLVEPTR